MLKIDCISSEKIELRLVYPQFVILAVLFMFALPIYATFIPSNVSVNCDKAKNICIMQEEFLGKTKQRKIQLKKINQAYLYKSSRASRVAIDIDNSKNYIYSQIGLGQTDKMIGKINAFLQNQDANNLDLNYKNNFLVFMMAFMSIPVLVFLILFFLGNAKLEFCSEGKVLKVSKISGLIKKQIPLSEIDGFYLEPRKKGDCVITKFKNGKQKASFYLKHDQVYLVDNMNEFLNS